MLQAPAIGAADVAAIAELADAQGIEVLVAVIAPGIPARQRDTASRGVAELCATKGIDCAFVPSDRTRDRVRVVAMDMDSTLITIECIDEIADIVGIKPEVAVITASAMRGEIDFAESLARRVALLAGLPVAALERVYDERLAALPGRRAHAGRLQVRRREDAARFRRIHVLHRPAADAPRVSTRRRRIRSKSLRASSRGACCRRSSTRQAKAARFAAMRRRYAADGGIAIAIGDGANDLPMLKAADVSIAYRAKPVVRAQATHAIDHCGLDAALHFFV